MSLTAVDLAAELSRASLEVLREATREHRACDLVEFGAVVRGELVHFLLGRFPELAEPWLREVLATHVHVSERRIEIDFDAIAIRVLDPSADVAPASTDPAAPPSGAA